MFTDTFEKQAISRHTTGGIRALMVTTGLGLVVIGYVIRLASALTSDFDGSMWFSVTSFTKGYLAVIGIMLVPVVLRLYVAQGITRRAFAIGSLGVLVGSSAVMAVLAVAGNVVEEGAYMVTGNSDSLGEWTVLGSWTQALLLTATYFLLHAVYFAGGWLTGAGWARFGWAGSTVMAILGLAAIAISEHLVGVDVSWNPIGHANVARLTIDLPAWLGGAVTVPFLVAAAVILTITALMSAGAFGMTRKATVA